MYVGILKEKNYNRVAIVPATIPKLKDLKLEILVEKDAGKAALQSNAAYEEVGAQVLDRKQIMEKADILISIQPLDEGELKQLDKSKVLISEFQPYNDKEITGKLQALGLRAFSLDMIPRTTLAQSMDVLSSMASISGYRAVLEAAYHLPRFFPMMITAAGSVKPAKVLILGAGVAGLQAVATAKRLGASVEAFDTRAAAKEEVESLGGKFIVVEGAVDDKGAGGYAVQQSEEYIKKQRAEVQLRASKSDIIITTAQVRGRKAPILLPNETVDKLKKGSVVVDLASSTGGNCELSKDNEVIQYNGVTIIGNSALSDNMPEDASFLYGTNILNFLKMLIKDGAINFDTENEIISGAWFTNTSQGD